MAEHGILHGLRVGAQKDSDEEEVLHSDSGSDLEIVDADGDEGENYEPPSLGILIVAVANVAAESCNDLPPGEPGPEPNIESPEEYIRDMLAKFTANKKAGAKCVAPNILTMGAIIYYPLPLPT